MNLRYEAKKIFSVRTFIIVIAIFLSFNCINIYKNNHPSNISSDAELLQKGRVAIHKLLEGEITQEKVDSFLNKYDELAEIVQSGNYSTDEADFEKYYCGYAYGDKNIFDEVYTEFLRQIGYAAKIEDIKNEATDNMNFFEENGNSLLYAQNKYIFSSFDTRRITNFYYTTPAVSLFTYNFSAILILLLIFLLFSPIFSIEKESDMLDLLSCTKCGHKKMTFGTIWLNKIKLLFFVVTFLVFIFAISDMVCLKLCLKFNGLLQPIYVLEEFQNTNLTCSIFTFWLLTLLLKWFGFIIIGISIIIVSKTQRNSAFSYLISLLLTVFFMCMKVYLNGSLGVVINFFNPISLFIIYKDFASFEMISNSNFFTMKYIIVILCNIVLFIILLFVLCRMPNRKAKNGRVLI